MSSHGAAPRSVFEANAPRRSRLLPKVFRGRQRCSCSPPGRGHRVFENAEVGDFRAATRIYVGPSPTGSGSRRVHLIAQRSLPSFSLVWGVTSPARKAGPDSNAPPAVRRRAASSLACSSEIAGPGSWALFMPGACNVWALAGGKVLREGHDRRRPDYAEITGQIRGRRGASIARTCVGPVPPNSTGAGAFQTAIEYPYVLVSTH